MDEFDMRDLFAGLAMVGDLAGRKHSDEDGEQYTFESVANRAYTMADEMLKAREPQEEIGIAAITRRKPK